MKKTSLLLLVLLFLFVGTACKKPSPQPDPEAVLTSLEVVTAPTKVVYEVGESFDPAGAKFEAKYSVGENVDVTDKVTFDKGVLGEGDEVVVASYKEGEITKTANIAITVKESAELIGDGLKLEKPKTGLVIEAISMEGLAKSNWFTEYKEDHLYVKVIVEDASIDIVANTFASDGVELLLYKTIRKGGLVDDTIRINKTAQADTILVSKALNGNYVDVSDHGVVHTFNKVSFDDKYVNGYQIELEIPYVLLDVNATDKNITFVPSLYNNDGSFAKIGTYSQYEANRDLTHTFVHITNDNEYAENPYLQLGIVFGNVGNLKTVPAWDLSNDTDEADASIEMIGVTNDTDNQAYFKQTIASNLFVKTKLTAKQVHNGEQYGKLGLMLTTDDGKNGIFYFVDALGDGINMSGKALAVVNRVDGNWNWQSFRTVKTLESADDYQNNNFIELGLYRQGDLVALYFNGERISILSGLPGITENSDGVVAIGSFNISLIAKEYLITDDETELEAYKFAPQPVQYLFVGDSYVDEAFWQGFELDFPISAANAGVGGSQTSNLVLQLMTLQTLYTPQNIIIHIGVNDINDGEASASDVAESIKSYIESLQVKFEGVNIYFVTIEPNNFKPDNWSKYQEVNNSLKALAETDDKVTVIDTALALGNQAGEAVAHYFTSDGLHLNADGYGIWVKTIKQALGIDYQDVIDGLGNDGAYARSSGWQYENDVFVNKGIHEQQIYFEGATGTEFAASIDLNVSDVYAGDQFPKVGFGLKSKDKTMFFFIDAAFANFDNKWGNHVIRPTGNDWNWDEMNINRQFVFLKEGSYSGDSFKTLEVVRLGTAIYFISDRHVVQYSEGVFAADEETSLSILTFNLKVSLKNAKVLSETEFETKLAQLQISEKTGPQIDGNLDDWTSEQKTNPIHIKGENGRDIFVYSYLAKEGIYVAYDALHQTPLINNAREWFNNTNIEFKFGDNMQRFASAKGIYSRFEPEHATRDVGIAKHTTVAAGELHNTIFEVFIPWAMIEGYSYETQEVKAGFAWKQPGEEGSIWGGGDFWYIPEADPQMQSYIITRNGFKKANDIEIDGSKTGWTEAILNTAWTSTSIDEDTGVTRDYSAVAFKGTDGLYGLVTIKTSEPMVFDHQNRAGDWFKNPNIEVWANEKHARFMIYLDELHTTGFVTEAAYQYDTETNTTTIEFFISSANLGLEPGATSILFRIGSNSFHGGWHMPVDPNQAVTAAGLPSKP